MTSATKLQSLSDDELLRHLSEIVQQTRRIEADLVAHIGEADDRRLYAQRACSSMFVYCIDVLHLSKHEAYERITAARTARKYPLLLEMLRDGRLHLSSVGKLAPHVTEENCERLLGRAAHKSKRQIEELLVELAPKPDVLTVLRKLPVTLPPMPIRELGPDRVTILPTQQCVPGGTRLRERPDESAPTFRESGARGAV